jgi:hypothetical protein
VIKTQAERPDDPAGELSTEGLFDPESIDWKLNIAEESDELPGTPRAFEFPEMMYSRRLGNYMMFRLMMDRYPALPDFGIFQLSITDAASLIAQDLSMRGKPPFDNVSDEAFLSADKAELREQLGKPLISQIQSHLLEAVKLGTILSRCTVRTEEEFISAGSDALLPNRTFVYYGDLLRWLARGGYLEWDSLKGCDKLAEYGFDEYALALEIEDVVKTRRRAGANQSESSQASIHDKNKTGLCEDAKRKNLLFKAYQRIEFLEEQLRSAKKPISRPKDASIPDRERDSLLKVLAAVCMLAGKGKFSSVTTSAVDSKAQQVEINISYNTIKKYLGESERKLKPKYRR